MNIEYFGEDGRIKSLGDNELSHFKYIKKIKTGSGWRYFYTPEEIKAYYQASKAVSNIKNDYADSVATRKMLNERDANKQWKKDQLKKNREIDDVITSKNGKIKRLNEKEKAKYLKDERKQIRAEYNKKDQETIDNYLREKRRNNFKRKYEPIINTTKAAFKGDIPKTAKLEKGKKTSDAKRNKKVSEITKKTRSTPPKTYPTKKNKKRSNPRSSNIRNNSIKKAR